jgi:hypothetical protein
MLTNETTILPAKPLPHAVESNSSVANSQATTSSGNATNQSLADLKRAFLRQSAQIRAYRAKRDQEMADATGD